ncbi:hypothetical protein TNCT_187921 [Trichonephila clavata]|uniref:Uncharacterized protein n=1 Tax=Trichonephila clavata TaxID=2740835 RepID=A0A8X6L333_TRICU|nr:hypothetical protein TNCT_187921 [Trichonephila clavata]
MSFVLTNRCLFCFSSMEEFTFGNVPQTHSIPPCLVPAEKHANKRIVGGCDVIPGYSLESSEGLGVPHPTFSCTFSRVTFI